MYICTISFINVGIILLIKMTVLRISKSGKALLCIDDDGRVYITSLNFLHGLLNGKSKNNLVLMSRLPTNCSNNHFQKSPVHDPNGIFQGVSSKTLDRSNDGLSNKNLKKNNEHKVYSDNTNVWG